MADDIKKKTRILGLDIETTGLDIENDKITEISFAIKDLGNPKILKRYTSLIGTGCEQPITDEITKITGINSEMIMEFGEPLANAFVELDNFIDYDVDFICAHNGDVFDRPFILMKDKQEEMGSLSSRFLNTPWIDTTKDLPYPAGMDTRKLKYLAFEHGILNHNAHDSLSDVESMLRLFDHYSEEEILKHIHEPNLIIRIATGFKDKEEAKKLRYSWQQLGPDVFQNCWIKRIKACDLDKEKLKTTFEITVLKEEKRA